MSSKKHANPFDYDSARREAESKLTIKDVYEMNDTIDKELLEINFLLKKKKTITVVSAIVFVCFILSFISLSYISIVLFVMFCLTLRNLNRQVNKINLSKGLIADLKITKEIILSKI